MKSIDELQKYVNEQMALTFEQGGFSPLVGRIFGLLLFSSEPVSLQEMAERLQVTKAAVSIQVRTLEQQGLCFKLARNNDRRDYYQIRDDFGMTVVQESTQQLRSFMQFLQKVVLEFSNLQEESAHSADSYRIAQRRFTEIKALYELLFEKLEGFEEEWEKRRKRLFADEIR